MKSFIILGLGRFGISLARTLIELGHEVLGADIDGTLVKRYADELTHIVEADITSEEFLSSLDVAKFDGVVVAVSSNLQVSIMTTLMLKDMETEYILAKAQNDFHTRLLYRIGVNAVILPEKDMGVKVAHNLVADKFLDMIEISQDHSIVNMHSPENWIGKSLGDLAIIKRKGLNVLAVRNTEDETVVLPDEKTVISEGDIVTVMGENGDLKKLESKG